MLNQALDDVPFSAAVFDVVLFGKINKCSFRQLFQRLHIYIISYFINSFSMRLTPAMSDATSSYATDICGV